MAKCFASGHLRYVDGEWRDDAGRVVDAVEVVRCRYCVKSSQYDDGSDNYVCRLGGTKKGSGFCSDGERKK